MASASTPGAGPSAHALQQGASPPRTSSQRIGAPRCAQSPAVLDDGRIQEMSKLSFLKRHVAIQHAASSVQVRFSSIDLRLNPFKACVVKI